MLGGSTSISTKPVFFVSSSHYSPSQNPDYMVYNTGSKDDWDYLSKVTCDPDLTWDAMAKYRNLNQKYVPPNDGHDDVSGVRAPSLHHSYPFLRQTSTSHQRTVAMGCYRSAFPATQQLSIRKSLQQLVNLNLSPNFPSNET